MADSTDRVGAALDIMMRMPPSRVEQSLSGIVSISPEDGDELLQRIDQPLQEQLDEATGKQYLICDYNRDGDSYRSPWSNKYDPPLEDGLKPPASLRELEMQANDVFTAYAQAYFTNPVTSVYFWDLEGGAFASCWLVKKELSGGRFVKEGSWDSIHVVEVSEDPKNKSEFKYKVTTTVMVSMTVESAELGSCNLSGSLIRGKSTKGVVDEKSGKTHIFHMGTLIENMENTLRETVEGIYLGKTNAVVDAIHKLGGHGGKVQLLGVGGAAK